MYAQLSRSVTQSLVFKKYNKSSSDFRINEYSRFLCQLTKLELAQVYYFQIKLGTQKFSEILNRSSIFTESMGRFSN